MKVNAYIHSLKDHANNHHVLMMCTASRQGPRMGKETDLPQRFRVTITETLKRTVEVEAGDQQQAEQIISDGWRNSAYILGPEDFVDVSFEIMPALDDLE